MDVNKAEHIRIDVNEYRNSDNTTRYSACAIKISNGSYRYTRRNFRHYHFDAGDRKIIVMSNFDMKHYQAENIANHYVSGKFKLEDTTGWD